MVVASDGRRICGTPGCNLPDFHKGPCAGWAPKKRVSQPVMQLNVRPEPVRSRAPVKPKRPYYPPKPKTAEELAAEAAAEAAARKPAEQRVLPSGLWPFYHAHRWGVPLPPGPVPPDEGSDDELDETWRAREAERRIDGRRGVDPADAELMKLWNAHVAASEKLVSDRALPAACRSFARAHAAALSTRLRRPLLEHLLTLCDHQLLHRDDAHDCLLIADAVAGGAGGSGGGPSPKKRKKGGGSPAASSSAADGADGDGVLGARLQLRPSLCDECGRPLHEENCALRGRARGAAAWPVPPPASRPTTQPKPKGSIL